MPRTRLITQAPSLVLACDVSDLELVERLAECASSSRKVGALKVGFTLATRYGLSVVVERIRRRSGLPVIYDHQKAGTDIPDLADPFADAMGPVDAVILFPLAGPETQKAFIDRLNARGKVVLIGGLMTHAAFLERDGGYVADDAPDRIFALAVEMGVRDFVVPGTRPDDIYELRARLETTLPPGSYDLFCPGIVTQGGTTSGLRESCGERWHAIVGRAVYTADEPAQAIEELAASF